MAVVACCCMLLHLVHPTPTCAVAGPDLQLACADGVFPTTYWRKFSTCTRCGHDSLQLALVVFSFKPFAQILYLHLCNLHCVVVVVYGGCMWW